MEGAQADPLDGMAAGLQFRGPSLTMSSDEYNRMMRGSNLQIQARDRIRFGETGKFCDDVERVFPNVFVFCCSIENEEIPHPDRMHHFKASDYWFLNSPESFAASIGKYLTANGRSFDGLSLDRLDCQMSCGPVAYKERSPALVEEQVGNIDLLVFQQERRFAIEQEYRIAWTLSKPSTGELVPVQSDPIDAPTTEFWLQLGDSVKVICAFPDPSITRASSCG